MSTRTQRATYRTVSLIVVTVVCAGCTTGTSRGPPSGPDPAGQHAAVITVGSFDFPESTVLADIYGDALKAKGFPVRILPNLGSRELVDPALMRGLIQVVPEYAGSALQFISLGRLSATADVMATNKALAELTAGQGVVAGLPADRAERQRHRRPPGDGVPVSPPVDRGPRPGRAAAGVRRPARMPRARLLPAWAEADV
jgi:osmoprotectant transport system substrate-binding protein